jgi:hypothetical protein
MRYAARLARLWRRVALLPPPDPMAAVSDEEMARAAQIMEARQPHSERDLYVWRSRGEAPPPRPEVAAADAAWFAREIEPRLPAYAAYAERLHLWQRRWERPRYPRGWRHRFACIFPAFAGKDLPRLRLPAKLLPQPA